MTWNELVVGHLEGSSAPAVVTATEEWSGDELLHRAGGAARWLDAAGFAPGAVVPALVDESPATVALVVGAALSGRALAPLGTKLPVSEIAAAVRGLGAGALVADAEHAAVAAGVGVTVHVLDGAPVAAEPVVAAMQPDAPLLVIHTSGTTGAPKPVVMTHERFLARIDIYAPTIGIGPGDRYCSASPFSHTAGAAMLLTALGIGATVIPWAWFSVDNWVLAGELGATCALLVPTMVDILLAERALAKTQVGVLQYGAAPIHAGTLTEAMDALPATRFVQIFGQTEVSPITALTHEDHVRARSGEEWLLATVGRARPGVELRVEDPDEEGVGEVAVRSPHAFVCDPDGWRRTGDLGSIDRDGYLSLRGRTGDRIVRGGENVYPLEVERALETHPGVREVAVVGMPDRRWGEIVKAVVVPADPAAPPSTEALQAFARQRLAGFKVPSVVEIADALPRNAAGKVVRSRLVR